MVSSLEGTIRKSVQIWKWKTNPSKNAFPQTRFFMRYRGTGSIEFLILIVSALKHLLYFLAYPERSSPGKLLWMEIIHTLSGLPFLSSPYDKKNPYFFSPYSKAPLSHAYLKWKKAEWNAVEKVNLSSLKFNILLAHSCCCCGEIIFRSSKFLRENTIKCCFSVKFWNVANSKVHQHCVAT